MRKFTGEELTQDQVLTLLKAALMSPSSKRSNCWQFIVIDDKDTLEKLSFCKESGAAFVKDAAIAIAVTADPLASDVWIEDASIASIMIQLQAEDLGLGSCWVQIRERFTANGVPANEYIHELWTYPYSYKCFPSSPLDIREWNANLLMNHTCNGKRYTSINTERNNGYINW